MTLSFLFWQYLVILEVGEPLVSLSINCLDDAFDAGNTVRFIVRLSHDPDSRADAHSLRVNTTLDHLNSDTLLTVYCFPSVQFNTYNGHLIIEWELLPLGSQLLCIYWSAADNTIHPEEKLTWHADLLYASAVNSSGRAYRVLSNDTKMVISISEPSYYGLLNTTSRGVTLTTDPASAALLFGMVGWAVAPGEAVYLLAEFSLPEVTTSADVNVSVSGTAVNISLIESESFAAYGVSVVNDSLPLLLQPNGQSISMSSGPLQNVADGFLSDGDIVRFYLVLSVSAEVGTTFELTFSTQFDGGSAVDSGAILTVNVTVTRPSLELDLTSTGLLADSGDSAVVTCTVVHDGASTGPAIGLLLSLDASLPFLKVKHNSTYYWFSDDSLPQAIVSDYQLNQSINILLLATGNVTVRTVMFLNDSCRSGQDLVVRCSGIYRDAGE